MTYSRGAAAYGRGANAYARVGVESGVMSADPHQLIVMLFDGAQAAIRAARIHMQAGNSAEKGRSISKALDIVNNGLAAALDREQGGDIAEQLGALYNYIARLLLTANLRNDEASLDEAERLLEDIASAWREIGQQQSA
ncbi:MULTISPECIES: flagellar export chaperone FliS [Halomonadaceae]|jgi:flagellar protein FliS|uniref:Flagellar secretion chaperone FliS n=1 Tax=Vreelandella janggokensis TaxID=370767 RepID=A0ABT4IWR3_9GAMM|nr:MULTISPECIES: flagellar export chaperone FliS [Halomonas]MCO7247800.1 flagellar export chaperone FliS [Halomonas sp. Mc5H-6]MCW4151253.1 flagellar export chaperone FliS [Halomonas sp. 18H]MCZ0928086.1 flagellar export chaperone FliS [Halomonas janggokensis]MDR5887248.1 flagellar export chaperone FliS [Halomonas janggokensis]QPL46330.1 flagellar export chaperone FliS [Halomonas sp. A40-4]